MKRSLSFSVDTEKLVEAMLLSGVKSRSEFLELMIDYVLEHPDEVKKYREAKIKDEVVGEGSVKEG